MTRIGCGLALFWLVVLLAFGELAARQAIDLKLYGSDSEVGYWVRRSLIDGFHPNDRGNRVLARFIAELAGPERQSR